MPDQTACNQPATGFVCVLCACSRLVGNKVPPTLERLRVRNSNAGSIDQSWYSQKLSKLHHFKLLYLTNSLYLCTYDVPLSELATIMNYQGSNIWHRHDNNIPILQFMSGFPRCTQSKFLPCHWLSVPKNFLIMQRKTLIDMPYYPA